MVTNTFAGNRRVHVICILYIIIILTDVRRDDQSVYRESGTRWVGSPQKERGFNPFLALALSLFGFGQKRFISTPQRLYYYYVW